MIVENNRESLLKAIEKLPEYAPPQEIWNAIDEELDVINNDQPLQHAIAELSTFEPPETLWNTIEQELDTPTSKRTTISFSKWSVAASVALLIAAFFAWQSTTNPEAKVEMIYTEIQEVEQEWKEDWDADEEDFQVVLAMLDENDLAKEAPESNRLQSELDELNLAKEELKMAISNFGQDSDLIRQLAEIERERTEILKKLASFI